MAEEVMLINPRKRRSTRRKSTSRKRRRPSVRRNPAPRRRRRRSPTGASRRARRVRRNPAPRGIVGKVNSAMMPAVQGAGGAIGLDLLMGYVPLPASISTGMTRHLVKGVGAVAMGYLASMIVRPKTAQNMMQGALTVTIHDATREMIQNTMPSIQLGWVNSGYYAGSDMSAYLDYATPESLPAPENTMSAYLDTGNEYDYSG